MKKETKQIRVSSEIFYDEELPIKQLLEKIEDAQRAGATHVHINSEYDSGSVEVGFYFERPETDDELDARLKREEANRKSTEDYERGVYERLKAKFETYKP